MCHTHIDIACMTYNYLRLILHHSGKKVTQISAIFAVIDQLVKEEDEITQRC